ncbi:MAG: ABC transporter substrate-binding protein [Rubrivivax sp.]
MLSPLLLLALSALTALAQAAEPLRIAVSKTPLSLPMFVAEAQGYFAAEGLQVKLIECVGGHRCLRQVLDDAADVATAGDLPIMFNSFERTDYAVLATIVTITDDVKLLVHSRAGVTKPEQLAGKRIGAVAGSASQYFLDLYLLAVGVDPKSLIIVHLQPEQMLPALRDGAIDAAAVWEPHAHAALQALKGELKMLPNAGHYLASFNLVAGRRALSTRDDDLVRLLRAVERAQRTIQDEPAAAKAVMVKRLQQDAQFVDWVWPTLNFRLSLDQSLITTLEGEARWALREGHAKGKRPANYMSLLHAGPLRAAKPSAVAVGR